MQTPHQPAAPAPLTLDGTGSSSCAIVTATLVYCVVPRRSDFDKLDLPLTDHGVRIQADHSASPMVHRPVRLLTKALNDHQDGTVTVIFQHWGLPLPRCAEAAAAQAAHDAKLSALQS